MIHQCYFDESQRERLFDSPLYRGFGLCTSVNPGITENCPELADPVSQHLLNEYAAMLHLWRNPEKDLDYWIGFTSYRQLDKFPTILREREALEDRLQTADILGWGFYLFLGADSNRSVSHAEFAEYAHPGIVSRIWHLLLKRDETIPLEFFTSNLGLYCNYWMMSKDHFNEWMIWSWPMVRQSLEKPDAYIKAHPRSLGYMIERLFLIWYMSRRKRLVNIGQQIQGVKVNNHYREMVPCQLQRFPIP